MNIIDKTMRRAIRASKKDGRLRFVFATAGGPRISTQRIPFQNCLWTNGQEWGLWEAHAPEGIMRGQCEEARR